MDALQVETVSRQTARPVPTRLLLWLTCGTLGSLLFTTTYLIEGATRPDYSAWQQAISALSLGPGGWVQQVNFVVFGVMTIWTAFAWRVFLQGGPGAMWYPILRGLQGLALIVDGFFSQDPALGYPKGRRWCRQRHTASSILSLPLLRSRLSRLASLCWRGALPGNLAGAGGPQLA
jgi:hypothetical protein